jgi:hypothetical protein
MRVDQAGYQAAALEIEDHGRAGPDLPVGDLADALALDQHVEALARLCVLAVDQRRVAEQNSRHAPSRPCETRAWSRHPSRASC